MRQNQAVVALYGTKTSKDLLVEDEHELLLGEAEYLGCIISEAVSFDGKVVPNMESTFHAAKGKTM